MGLKRSFHAQRGDDRQAFEIRVLREVVAVDRTLERAMVVGVEHVDVRVEHPGVEGPGPIEPDVELVEGGQAEGIDRTVNREVGVEVGEVARADHRRGRISGNDSITAADLPSVTESIRSDRGQVVRLIEVEETARLAGPVDSVAAREGIRDPAEEPLRELFSDQQLQTVDTAD